MSQLSRLSAAAVVMGTVGLGAVPAGADFCLEATKPPDSYFFRFKQSYPSKLKPGKLLALQGKLIAVEGGSVVGTGPAWGQLLGLPEGDAGYQLGISFAYGTGTAGTATITLDDNGGTTGGGTIFVLAGSSTSVGAEIVDCSTEPVP